jgi:hypothetical protein
VKHTNKAGEEHSGDFELEFSARGFGPGCNSTVTPRFTFQPKAVEAPAGSDKPASSASEKPSSKRDSRDQDQGEDAPVAPPDQSGYAK